MDWVLFSRVAVLVVLVAAALVLLKMAEDDFWDKFHRRDR